MTIGDDIAQWARTRPIWQQEILQTLAEGVPVMEPELAAAIASLLDPPAPGPARSFDLALASGDDVTVTLSALRGCKGVNALTDDQDLEFAVTGLTVIYGDNGSGKSGYARLVKEAVGARHPTQVLPDVFLDRPNDPSALMQYAADHDQMEHKVPGPADALIRQMHFYDEHCGDAYLARKSAITYRPSALVLLDGLIDVCDRLRKALAERLQDNIRRAINLDLPPGTAAAQFVARLTADTTEAAIKSATVPDPDATQKLADATSEVARLEASNASVERARLTSQAQASAALSSLLSAAGEELGDGPLEQAQEDLRLARGLREAAVVAATADFTDELPGVGGAAWRALWEAARAYSTTDAYHSEPFPVTHDSARCPLCQQELSFDARSRLDQFDRYMRDTTERDASAAELVVRARLERWRDLSVGIGSGVAHLATLREAAPGMAAQVQARLEAAGIVRDAAVVWLEDAGDRPEAIMDSSVIQDLDAQTAVITTAAAAVDVEAFTASLGGARSRAHDIEAHIRLCESSAALQMEVEGLKERRLLEAAQTQVMTTAITVKSTELTKRYAGEVIKDSFVRETERLRLRRVTIRDLGGKKGQLEQQPGLLGAKAAGVQAAQVLRACD